MKQVKKTAEYTIFQRNDERYAVRAANRSWINGDDKVAILQAEGLVKKPEPKPAEPEVAAAEGEAASE
ncbi:hypothetical protein [Teredinibacter purpureus]|uniref:hypothetical protein n=1 Tax=Teredinibacter purpureus TaxID=2731756 RepID=UPI0005F7C78B|nr:hypothetical protein [Teredinibacter purpureus]